MYEGKHGLCRKPYRDRTMSLMQTGLQADAASSTQSCRAGASQVAQVGARDDRRRGAAGRRQGDLQLNIEAPPLLLLHIESGRSMWLPAMRGGCAHTLGLQQVNGPLFYRYDHHRHWMQAEPCESVPAGMVGQAVPAPAQHTCSEA